MLPFNRNHQKQALNKVFFNSRFSLDINYPSGQTRATIESSFAYLSQKVVKAVSFLFGTLPQKVDQPHTLCNTDRLQKSKQHSILISTVF